MVRRGSRNSPARCVTASQPANAQTYRLRRRRRPTSRAAGTARGAAGSADGRDDQHDEDHEHDERAGEHELHRSAQPQPDGVGDERRQRRAAPTGRLPLRPAEHRDDVLRPEQRHDGRPDADAEEEPVAGRAAGRGPEGEPDVGRDAAGVGVPGRERGERRGERHRQRQDAGDGEQGRGAGRPGGEGRAAGGSRCRARRRRRARSRAAARSRPASDGCVGGCGQRSLSEDRPEPDGTRATSGHRDPANARREPGESGEKNHVTTVAGVVEYSHTNRSIRA